MTTNETAKSGPTDPEADAPERAGGNELVGAGIATAILVPVVGLIIGIVLLFKNRVGPGLGCILLSLATGAIYVALVAPEVFKDERSTTDIQSEITRWADEQTEGGGRISTDCPDPVEWRVGETFHCVVEQDGQSVGVTVTMENDDGAVTWITG